MNLWTTARGPAWHDGYIVDVPYIEPVSHDLCPAHLSMVAVLHGQPPLDESRRLSWVELGSGGGMQCCIVAAANANVDVWGCDVNPAHVERAQGLANAAGLAHCTFDLASFADVARDRSLGPDEADVIVIHGVYSWIAPENQRHIADIINQRLRPGGLVYVSYESPTGWAAMAPIAEALRLHVAASGRRSDLGVADAAAALHRLADAGAQYFPLPAFETRHFTDLVEANPRYAAHEYLGGHFRPVLFPEVVDVMGAAGCTFIGAIEATDHLQWLWAPPELVDTVTSTEDLALRQVLRDMIAQRALRRDVFRRGIANVTVGDRQRWLHDLTLVGLGKTLDDSASVATVSGDVSLDPVFYAPLIEVLQSSPLGFGGVASIHPGWGEADVIAALSFLVQGGYAAPLSPTWDRDGVRAASRRLNEVIIAENRRGADHRCLVAPTLGSSIDSEYIETLTLGAMWEGFSPDAEDLTSRVLKDLDAIDFRVIQDGELIEDATEARMITRQRVERTLDRIAGPFERLAVS